MKALYRKYRPTKLQDVIGEEQVTKPLAASLKSGKISHAYLFTGPRGCGKTSVARIFAHEINGFKYEIEDNYVDIIEIDAASNTGVDNIRDLREKAAIAPTEGKYKVYIIDEVHMLSKSAFNALLKTLEEPPKSVVFIMATTDAYKVPVTITSRAQNYVFHLATPDVMLKHLEDIAKKEKIDIEKAALELIVKKGGGSFRDTISLLDQISTLEDAKITKDTVITALGLPEEAIIADLLTAYQQGNIDEIHAKLQAVLNTGIKPETLAENLIAGILKNPQPELLSLLKALPEVQGAFPEAKLLVAFLGPAIKQPVMTVTAPAAVNSQPAAGQSATPAATQPTPKTMPEKAPETMSSATQPATTSAAQFDWSAFVESTKSFSAVIYSTLQKCQHQYQDGVLTIYPRRKIDQSILSHDKNNAIIGKLLPEGVTLDIKDGHEIVKKDPALDQISDIMGDIQEVNANGVPF